MKTFEFHAVETAAEALRMMRKFKGKAALLAGGSDLVPKLKSGALAPVAVIDIKKIEALRGIRRNGKNAVSIGSLVTLAEIAESPLIRKNLPVLSETALMMASPQVRNRATVGGNLSNAAPSADMAPPLLALGARVELHTQKGKKTVPLEDFFLGPGKTLAGREGLLSRIIVPVPPKNARVHFLPLCIRKAMDLSIVSAAAYVERERGIVKTARIALGAVAPVPLRAKAAEKKIIGTEGGAKTIAEAALTASQEARPITDVRACKEYRCEMVRVTVERALREVMK